MQTTTEKRPPSWRVGIITVILPFEYGTQPSLIGVKSALISNEKREKVNQLRKTEGQSLGRDVRITGEKTSRPVAHTGKQLGEVRDRTIHVEDVLSPNRLGMIRQNLSEETTGTIWGRYVREEDNMGRIIGRKVEIRSGKIFPWTDKTGLLDPDTLTAFIEEMKSGYDGYRGDWMTVQQIWINPEKFGPGPDDFTGKRVANIRVVAAARQFKPISDEELSFFVDEEGNPRIGSRTYGLRYPDYE